MKVVVARPDAPTPHPDTDSPTLRPPASRGRFAAVAILCGLLGGGLIFVLLLADGGWPALVLCLSLGLCFSSVAAMLVFRRVQVPLEAAHGAAMAGERVVLMSDGGPAAEAPQPPAEPAQHGEHLDEARESQVDRLRAQLAAITAASSDALLLLAADGRIEQATPAAAALVGERADALIERPFSAHFSLYDNRRPEPLQHPLAAMLQTLLSDPRGEPLSVDALLERRGRTSLPLRVQARPLAGQRGSRGGLLRFEQADEPSATPAGMGRSALGELLPRIAALQDQARIEGSRHGLLLIASTPDHRVGLAVGEQRRWLIERTLGELAGDLGAVLSAAPGLQALLIPRCDAAQLAAHAGAVAAAIAALPAVRPDDTPQQAELRIGSVLIDAAEVGPEHWLDAAHRALQAATVGVTATGVAGALSVAPDANPRHDDWLRRKLAGRAVRLVAQAIVPVDGGGARPSVELLPRIEDDDGVWVPTDSQADALARLGLAAAFDLAVIDATLSAGLGDRRALLRLSPAALMHDDFIDALADRLLRSTVPVKQLMLSIDEACVLEWPRQAARLRECLLPMGVERVLDACLGVDTAAALRLWPAQALRPHPALLTRHPGDGIDRAKVEVLVRIARSQGVRTIASGVDDPDTRERLRLAGIDFVQGSAVSPPTPYSA